MSSSQNSSCPSCGAGLIPSEAMGVSKWVCFRCGFEQRSAIGRSPSPSSANVQDIEQNKEEQKPPRITDKVTSGAPPTSSVPKFCRYCGAFLSQTKGQGSKFCPNCGHSLRVIQSSTAEVIRVEPPAPHLRASPRHVSSRREIQTETEYGYRRKKMKPIHAVIGSVLVILGVIFIIFALIIVSGTCSTSNTASALFGVPTCSQAATEFFSLLIAGISFAIIGGVVLMKGRQKVPISPTE